MRPKWMDAFFSTEEDIGSEDESTRANDYVVWARMPPFDELLEWLEREVNRPELIGDHTQMIVNAARRNTLLEIRDHLTSQRKKAEQAVAMSRGLNVEV